MQSRVRFRDVAFNTIFGLWSVASLQFVTPDIYWIGIILKICGTINLTIAIIFVLIMAFDDPKKRNLNK